ncbi:hypothetical protein MPSEU_000970300 [Mayamaea pseudoterrestris]|nr:hypothetical protein MPSEU_000970300 [Mayamaea pseudoterrestris]
MNLSLTLTLYVPSACVGALIGRKGATMVELQTFAAKYSTTSQPVRISVVHGTNQQQQQDQASSNNTNSKTAAPAPADAQQNHAALPSSSIPTHTPPDLFNPHWTPVVVKADAKACLAAGLAVQSHVAAAAAVASAASSSNHHNECCDNDNCDDDVVLDVPVARTKHSAMVGKRGVLLANASADFGVRIMVPAKQASNNMNVIQLEGKLVNVISCLERLMSIAVTIKGTVNNNNTVAAATTKKQGSNAAAASTPSGTSPETAVESNDGPAPLHQHQATITLAVCPALAKVRSIVRKTDTIVKRKQVPAASNAPLASEEAMVDEETINDADNATTDSKVTSSTAVFSWELTVSGNTHESVQAAVDLLQAASATAHPAPKPLWHRRRRPANKPKGNGK